MEILTELISEDFTEFIIFIPPSVKQPRNDGPLKYLNI